MRLYEIPQALRAVEAAIIEAEGELTPEMEAQLEALTEDFDRKVEYLALLAREAKAEAAGYKVEADRLAAHVRAASNREAGIKRYLQFCLESAGVPKVTGTLATVALQKNGQPSIRYDGDPQSLPPAYQRVTVAVDTRALHDALKGGEDLPEGVTVEHGQHVRIR